MNIYVPPGSDVRFFVYTGGFHVPLRITFAYERDCNLNFLVQVNSQHKFDQAVEMQLKNPLKLDYFGRKGINRELGGVFSIE